MKTIRKCWRVPALLAAAMALFVGGWATRAATGGFSQDGPGWRSVSSECGIFYVDGFNAAYRLGTADVRLMFIDRLAAASLEKKITREEEHKLTADEPEPSQNDVWTNKMSWTGWTSTKETSAQIKEDIDRFYANPANQGICWTKAFLIVSHSMAGQTFSEADMRTIRQVSAKNGCE
jgi:hypothetical protein